MNNLQPVIFLGHGSPMNIVQKNKFTETLTRLGKKISKPRAILVISAHWLEKGTYFTCMDNPPQIYDFYGFPKELYEIEYICKGAPDFTAMALNLLKKFDARCSDQWGIDHGSWSLLVHMFPKADVPVFQMSIDNTKPEEYHYKITHELKKLREEGVLIIGSGNIVHNLRMVDFNDINAKPYDWAVEFDEYIKNAIDINDTSKLIEWELAGQSGVLSVPSNDHYLPLLYIMGLRETSDKLSWIFEGFQNKSVSMRGFMFG